MKLNPTNEEVVDFDYFHLEEPFWNTNVAQRQQTTKAIQHIITTHC